MISLWWKGRCSFSSIFFKAICIAIISSATFNCESSSQAWSPPTSTLQDRAVQWLDPSDVMEDKFGVFNFEELDQYLYSVDISMQPVMAVSPEAPMSSEGPPRKGNTEDLEDEVVRGQLDEDLDEEGSSDDTLGAEGTQRPSGRPEGGEGPSEGSPEGGEGPSEGSPEGGEGPSEGSPEGGEGPSEGSPEGGEGTERPSEESPEGDEGTERLLESEDDEGGPSQEGERRAERVESAVKVVDVEMISKRGQKYRCGVPDLTPATKETLNSTHFPNVSQILSTLENKTCLIKNAGWWTYEYCHGRFLRQYHLEAGKLVGESVYMGFYANETIWNKTTIDKVTDIVRSVKNNLPYEGQTIVFHSVLYDNGTVCDLTGKPRRTLVKMMCGMSGEDKLSGVEERDTCNYVVHIHTPLLCAIPIFSQIQHGKEKVIMCSPVVSKETYRQYIKAKKEENRKELSRLEMAAQRSSMSEDSLRGSETSRGTDPRAGGTITSTPLSSQPLPLHNDMSALNLALLKMLERLLGPERKPSKEVSKRQHLLEKLVRKVQPGYSEEEVRKKAQEILQKGGDKSFDLEYLRDLIEEGEEGALALEGKGAGGERSGGKGVESDEEDEEDVWDQLSQLDDEALAALEVDVTAELRKKLSEMGMPTEGDVKLKVIKLSDLDLDNDDDEESDLESPDDSEKETKIRVVELGILTDFDDDDDLKSRDGPLSAERRKVSDLESGYRSLWEEEKQKKKD